MWLHDSFYASHSMYLESWVCRLRGALDIAALDWTIQQLVIRHSALHSGIWLEGKKLVQVLLAENPIAIERLRCAEASLDGELWRLARRPLDLRESPVRVTCIEVAVGDVVVVWQLHHLVVDDWALAILETDFKELYCARVAGRRPELPSLPKQPRDYAADQRARGVDPELIETGAGAWRMPRRRAP